jgi:hypothetical protein
MNPLYTAATGGQYSSLMYPASTPAPGSTPSPGSGPTTDPAALEQKAMQTILGMFNQASQADIAEMNAMRPQLMSAPGGASPQGMHTVAAPVQAAVPRAATPLPPSLASVLLRR